MRSTEISRRLKAARWLAGGEHTDGKPKALAVEELAARQPLPTQGITANRLEEIEQLKITPPPMELEQIALALRMPTDWFSVEKVAPGRPDMDAIYDALRTLGGEVADLRAKLSEQPPASRPAPPEDERPEEEPPAQSL